MKDKPSGLEFGAEFQHLANFMAVAETRSENDTICEVILHTLLAQPQNRLNPKKLRNSIEKLIGLKLERSELDSAVRSLKSAGKLIEDHVGSYLIDELTRENLKAKKVKIEKLETSVKSQWNEEVLASDPDLDFGTLWTALLNYMAFLFSRHGLQAVQFLDTSTEGNGNGATSLPEILTEVVSREFGPDPETRDKAEQHIRDFFRNVTTYTDRVRFIAMMADTAFNYYSLKVHPEVSRSFRRSLDETVLLLDTNVLFGILDMHVAPQVEVSKHLVKLVAADKLPFRLKYLSQTMDELKRAVESASYKLRRSRWSAQTSRIATKSPYTGGIELKYHQRNAVAPTHVDSFLRRFENVDVLLEQQGIFSDSELASGNRLYPRANVLADYTEYLKKYGKQKPPISIDHDVSVLDTVLAARANPSDNSVILVTCDYTLYGFDLAQSKQQNRRPAVVVPSLLLQVVRPYITTTDDYDRALAQAFAIPEFRSLTGADASQAVEKYLSIVNSYSDLPEETAVKLITKDSFIRRLTKIENDADFVNEINEEIKNQNIELMEELEAAKQQRELEARAKDEEIARLRLESTAVREQLESRDKTILEIDNRLVEVIETSQQNQKEVEKRTQRRVRNLVTGLIVTISLLLFVLLLVTPSPLRDHPKSTQLSIIITSLFATSLLAVVHQPWRKQLIAGFSLELLVALLSLV